MRKVEHDAYTKQRTLIALKAVEPAKPKARSPERAAVQEKSA